MSVSRRDLLAQSRRRRRKAAAREARRRAAEIREGQITTAAEEVLALRARVMELELRCQTGGALHDELVGEASLLELWASLCAGPIAEDMRHRAAKLRAVTAAARIGGVVPIREAPGSSVRLVRAGDIVDLVVDAHGVAFVTRGLGVVSIDASSLDLAIQMSRRAFALAQHARPA